MKQNMKKAVFAAALAAVLVGSTAASCDSTQSEQSKNSEKMQDARNNKLGSIILCGEANDSLECKNLKERKRQDEDPNRVTYLYLVNMQGEPFAYWVVKGKVSSNQSQMAPMDQAIQMCGYSECWTMAESPGDDGSFGPNEDGIFFFTTDGNKIVVGGGNYIQSNFPFALPGVKELTVRK
jgi:hypothetical protein